MKTITELINDAKSFKNKDLFERMIRFAAEEFRKKTLIPFYKKYNVTWLYKNLDNSYYFYSNNIG